MREVVIIGAGPAGCAAAVQCRRLGLDVTLLDKTGVPGGLISNAFCIENYPGLEGPLAGPEFAARLADHLDRFQLKVSPFDVDSVKRTHAGDFEVSGGAKIVHAKNVVLATGTLPMQPQISGLQALGGAGRLFYGVREFFDATLSASSVAIIGGGEASLDYALSLARTGLNVTILCRGTALKTKGRLVELVKNNPNIQISLESEVIKINLNKRGAALQVTVSAGEPKTQTIQCDALIVAIGRTPVAADIVVGMDLCCKGDPLTPAAGLFICGDARLGTLGQVGIAIGDGLAAAMKIADSL